ncbi:DUF2061 domain-containing protein [Lutibacter sp.]|uniref:DUF2061 domain-containing protein n=1 Tax=Lutibacter sp. TaxID=1925666 RepID=UPI0025C0D527|nr:DUF2061 domain-containing protein [Lutibacter sp.]MCF6169253.1 DUF2061 domain-containing protein [Lutibacter sp.]
MIIDQIFTWNNNKSKKTNESEINSEKPARSIVKAISWRIVGTIDTILISWFITGKITLALSIGLIEIITKMVLYFFHERIWNLIKWGKQ